MEQAQERKQTFNQAIDMNNSSGIASSSGIRPEMPVSPQSGGGQCTTCGDGAGFVANGAEMTNFIFALGTVEPRFPSLGVEKEFAQVTGQMDTAGLTDRQALSALLSERSNRYLARRMCYVLTIEGVETYILQPHDPTDIDLLVEAVRPAPQPTDINVVIGVRGPIAPPDLCNGLMIPIVIFDQLYSFDTNSLIKAIPRPAEMTAEKFEPTAMELLTRIMQLADNAGSTDEHRAVNYLAVRNSAIYATVADLHGRNFSLTAVEVRPSRLSGTRKIVDIIFCFTNRQTDVMEKYFVRVDVTEEFPFMVTKMSPFYER